ncbi:MAG TPA: hypothetical protein PLW65_24250 [Pseudomonadota bacterium]|nr:hypothetical protein [Pseudomonadota bacterium]
MNCAAGEKTFMMFRSRRYDADRLQRFLKELSWETVQCLKYGASPSSPGAAVMLLRRS